MSTRQAESERWLRTAQEDLAYARHAAGSGFHAPACFFAQQAAEKAVKALHYAGGARAVVGHSVRSLIESLTDPPPSLVDELDSARELDLVYLPARYPNGLETGTPAEAFSGSQSSRAVGQAQSIVDAVLDEIAVDG